MLTVFNKEDSAYSTIHNSLSLSPEMVTEIISNPLNMEILYFRVNTNR